MRDLVHVSAKAYTREEILRMETTILSTLNFQVRVPCTALLSMDGDCIRGAGALAWVDSLCGAPAACGWASTLASRRATRLAHTREQRCSLRNDSSSNVHLHLCLFQPLFTPHPTSQITMPTSLSFLARFQKVVEADVRLTDLSNYYAERMLQEYGMLKHLPSTVAAAAMSLALKALGRPAWVSSVERTAQT